MSRSCPFCHPPQDRMIAESEYAYAIYDAYPVTEGHTLVIPREHVAGLFELDPKLQLEIWALVRRVRSDLMNRHHPDGFTIGVNDGKAAGQTVMHAHVHVIPRRHGDVADPRGGIRGVIPDRTAYWSED